MKEKYIRRGAAILMAAVLLAVLPATVIGEATPSDLGEDDSGDNEHVTVVEKQIVTKSESFGKVTVTVTSCEEQESGAAFSISKITDEAVTAEITEKMKAFEPQAEEGQTVETQHLLLKISDNGILGGATVKIEDTAAGSGITRLTATYNPSDKTAVSAGTQFGIPTENSETIVDCMLVKVTVTATTNTQQGDTAVQGDPQDQDDGQPGDSQKQGGGQQDTPQEPGNGQQDTTNQSGNNTAVQGSGSSANIPGKTPESSGSGSSTGTTSSQGTDNVTPGGAPTDGNIHQTGSSDKSSLVAISGGSKGAGISILNPAKKTNTVINKNTGVKAVTTSSEGPGSGNAAENAENSAEGIYSIAGGYNVVLIGVTENDTKSETWTLLQQRGIVFEDFRRGMSAPEDTEVLLQTGMDGIRKEDDPAYWNSPGAAKTPADLIDQFGFYRITAEGKKENDGQVLTEAAAKIENEGLPMNARHIPFFIQVQLTGSSREDSLARLITDLETLDLAGNTVLIFTLTGREAEKTPLIIVHPEVLTGMTVKTQTRSADLLTTVLSLSGNAEADRYRILDSMQGRNMLTTEEFDGMEGLIPEPPAAEETADAETEEDTEEPAGQNGQPGGAPVMTGPGGNKNGYGPGYMPGPGKPGAGIRQVTTNSAGPGGTSGGSEKNVTGPGSDGPGSEADDTGPGSPGPGGDSGGDEKDLLGPAAEYHESGPSHP